MQQTLLFFIFGNLYRSEEIPSDCENWDVLRNDKELTFERCRAVQGFCKRVRKLYCSQMALKPCNILSHWGTRYHLCVISAKLSCIEPVFIIPEPPKTLNWKNVFRILRLRGLESAQVLGLRCKKFSVGFSDATLCRKSLAVINFGLSIMKAYFWSSISIFI